MLQPAVMKLPDAIARLDDGLHHKLGFPRPIHGILRNKGTPPTRHGRPIDQREASDRGDEDSRGHERPAQRRAVENRLERQRRRQASGLVDCPLDHGGGQQRFATAARGSHFDRGDEPRAEFGKSPLEHQGQSARSEPGEIAEHNPKHEARHHKRDRRDGHRFAEPPRQFGRGEPEIGPIDQKSRPKECSAHDEEKCDPFQEHIPADPPPQLRQNSGDGRTQRAPSARRFVSG